MEAGVAKAIARKAATAPREEVGDL